MTFDLGRTPFASTPFKAHAVCMWWAFGIAPFKFTLFLWIQHLCEGGLAFFFFPVCLPHFFSEIFYLKAGVQPLQVPGNDLSSCCDTMITPCPFRGKAQSPFQGAVMLPASPLLCGLGSAAVWERCGALNLPKRCDTGKSPTWLHFGFLNWGLTTWRGGVQTR